MKAKHGALGNQEYQIRPKQREKFKPGKAKEIITKELTEKLKGQTYNEIATQTKQIADDLKYCLKGMELPRYKFMVNVIIGQQKGQGVRVGTRCFWDFDTDYVASDYFINEHIFCLVTVYAVYLY